MSKFTVKHEASKPKIELLQMPSQQVKTEIDNAGLKLLFPTLLDYFQDYFYAKAEDWAKVFDWIYFKNPMPKYENARFDCEDFAIWMKGLVGANFGLNYFGVVLGNSPLGYHGWDIFKTEGGLLQLEPQSGKFFEIGERGYFPEWVLL